MIAGVVTLYGGLIFVQERTVDSISIIFFIMIMFWNVKFFILWTYAVLWVYRRNKYINTAANWYKKAFCLNVSYKNLKM